jgi:hypothetical protein
MTLGPPLCLLLGAPSPILAIESSMV